MAQKDIQSIAEYMKEVEQEKASEDKAYDEAAQEEQEFQAEDDAMLDDDEIIDPKTLGFIDDTDCDEDNLEEEDDDIEAEKALNESVIRFARLPESIDPNDGRASITVEVYNEDGFGKHFAEELMSVIPQVAATVLNRRLPNGDIKVKLSGLKDDLEKAFAFYVGKPSYQDLSNNDKDEFNSLLVFDDGDTLAEADYREAVAHCLDPIGVKASTANLVKKDSCALSLVKEEKARRMAKKMLKCLKENDFSELTDKELDIADKLNDKMISGSNVDDEDLSPEEKKVWEIVLDQMGYTPEEWDELSPEEQEKVFKQHPANKPATTKTGFSEFLTDIDPKTGKRFKYRPEFPVYVPRYKNPKTGEQDPDAGKIMPTGFNPDYSIEDSPYHNRNMQKREKKAKDQQEKDLRAKEAMKSARGKFDEFGQKSTWTLEEFFKIISNLDNNQRKELMNSLIDYVEQSNPDSQKAGEEIRFIKTIFGKKQTLRDLAKAWNVSFPAVKFFKDKMEETLFVAARETTGDQNALLALKKIFASDSLKKKYQEKIEEILNKTPIRKDTINPERVQRILKLKAQQNQENS